MFYISLKDRKEIFGQDNAYALQSSRTKEMTNEIYIRKALPDDFDEVMRIYADARQFMKENGNPDQWGDSYPSAEMVKEDLSENGHGFVATDGKKLLAAFYFEENADDPTYREIFDGAWLNDLPYGVIHRIGVAKAGRGRKIGKFCISRTLEQNGNIRIDTHICNLPMQRLLASLGFVHCGSIYLEDGSHRMAYQCISEGK